MKNEPKESFWDWLFSSSCCGKREKSQPYRPEEDQNDSKTSSSELDNSNEETTEVWSQEGGEFVDISGYIEDEEDDL